MALPIAPGSKNTPEGPTPARGYDDADGEWETPISPNSVVIPPLPSSLAPQAPVVAAPDARLRASYISVGQLTSKQLLDSPTDLFAPIEDKIAQVVKWVQNALTDAGRTDDVAMARAEGGEKRDEVGQMLDALILEYANTERDMPRGEQRGILIAAVINEVLGLGPLEPLWKDPDITEIMVNGPRDIQVEIGGKVRRVNGAKFRDQEHLLSLCQQILGAIGRRVDTANPIEDGRLADFSRVHVVHTAIAPAGPNLTIRRHREESWTVEELVKRESFTEDMATELAFLIYSGCSTIIVGGTGSGKSLSLDTKIPTPTDMTTMGALKMGDKVLDEHGNPTTVTNIFDHTDKKCFNVTFSDGTEVVAGEDHNWFTSMRSSRRAISRVENLKQDRKRTKVLTVQEVSSLNELRSLLGEDAIISISDLIHAKVMGLERIRNIAYRVAKSLTPVIENKREKKFVATELIDALLVKSEEYDRDQRSKSAVESVVTTQEIFDTLRTPTGHTNHAVRMMDQPVDYAPSELPISPYVFGQWLGDGSSYGNRFETIDIETRDEFRKEGYWVSSEHKAMCRVDSVMDKGGMLIALRSLGVIKTSKEQGETKFVPDVYLYSSVQQRRDLLAGMLDSDGTVSKSTGVVSFTNANLRLIDGFRQVAHSLGYQTTTTSKIPTYPYKGEKKIGKRAYTVSLFANHDVFRLTRKNEIHRSRRSEKQAGHRSELRYITAVTEVATVPTRCITVDAMSHLFLCTDAFIPTHNTTVLNALSGLLPFDERIITIEDNLELQLHPDKLLAAPMEARPASSSGSGAVTIRDLVRASLRMRPNRIIVGEVRDASAYDMLQAMNTGHNGSMTTIHANGADEVVMRLESLVLQSGEMEPRGVTALIAGSVDLFVVVEKYPEDGSRRVSGIYEVPSRVTNDGHGGYELLPIPLWEFVHDSTDPVTSKVIGHYEKKNELSASIIHKHRLDRKKHFTIEEVFAMSSVTGVR
jgi:Flp pilus assembly CpaF family ATPase